MTPTRVNAAIWARLLSDTRFRGIKMQQVQCLLLKAIVAQTWVTASFLKLKETTPGATSPASYPALLLPRGQCGTRRETREAPGRKCVDFSNCCRFLYPFQSLVLFTVLYELFCKIMDKLDESVQRITFEGNICVFNEI